KAFLSQQLDKMRLPYAYADSSFQRRTSFFGSVNEDTFLADPTGNSRFWVLPVTNVNHEHDIDMQQLWAQVLTLWDGGQGEQHWMSQDDMASVSKSNAEFEVDDPIYER